jgi:hypothetical protein
MDVTSKLIQQIREDLPVLVSRLNDKRGLVRRFKGDKYKFTEDYGLNGARFNIVVTNRAIEKGKQGRPIIASIIVDENKDVERPLTIYGSVLSRRGYSTITDYLHGLSHETGVLLSRHVFSDIDSRL